MREFRSFYSGFIINGFSYYDSYLPNAFDESLTILQKMNLLIEYLNRVIDASKNQETWLEGFTDDLRKQLAEYHRLNNEDLEEIRADIKDFKDVMEKFRTDLVNNLLPEHTTNILNQWFENGKLADIINNDVFGRKADKKDESLYDGQTDFVKLIQDRQTLLSCGLKKQKLPYEGISVFGLLPGNRHISYSFKKNNNDDYMLLCDGFTGEVQSSIKDWKSTSNKTGTWTTDTANNSYTTTVGDTFTVIVAGENIYLNHFSDTRGGMFEITIDGDISNKKIISTWNIEQVSKSVLIASNLKNTEHTVIGKFIGNDPAHAPSSTDGKSRGWIKDAVSHVSHIQYTAYATSTNNGSYSNNTMVLGYGSNKEFAFDVEVNGDRAWFPEHNSTGTAFKIKDVEIYLDNKLIDINNLEYEVVQNFNEFLMVQKFNCRLPNILTPVAEMTTYHRFNKSGALSVDGYIQFKMDAHIHNGYTMMLPLADAGVKELLTGLHTHIVNDASNELIYLPLEYDRVYQHAGIDTRNKDYIVAVEFEKPNITLRKNKEGRPNDEKFIYFNKRVNYPKLYAQAFKNYDVKAGERFEFAGKFIIGNIKDIYNIVK